MATASESGHSSKVESSSGTSSSIFRLQSEKTKPWESSHPETQGLFSSDPLSGKLKENMPNLISHLTIDSLWCHLDALNVINRMEKERIVETYRVRQQQTEEMVYSLFRRPTWAFHGFLRALALSNQEHLLRLFVEDISTYNEDLQDAPTTNLPEQYSFLSCIVCEDLVNDNRVLACAHSVCKTCVEEAERAGIDEIECSVTGCARSTSLREWKVNLQHDEHIQTLSDIQRRFNRLNHRRHTNNICGHCKVDGHTVPSSHYCQTCPAWICGSCFRLHQVKKNFSGHDISHNHHQDECCAHQREAKSYCEVCRIACCQTCELKICEHSPQPRETSTQWGQRMREGLENFKAKVRGEVEYGKLASNLGEKMLAYRQEIEHVRSEAINKVNVWSEEQLRRLDGSEAKLRDTDNKRDRLLSLTQCWDSFFEENFKTADVDLKEPIEQHIRTLEECFMTSIGLLSKCSSDIKTVRNTKKSISLEVHDVIDVNDVTTSDDVAHDVQSDVTETVPKTVVRATAPKHATFMAINTCCPYVWDVAWTRTGELLVSSMGGVECFTVDLEQRTLTKQAHYHSDEEVTSVACSKSTDYWVCCCFRKGIYVHKSLHNHNPIGVFTFPDEIYKVRIDDLDSLYLAPCSNSDVVYISKDLRDPGSITRTIDLNQRSNHQPILSFECMPRGHGSILVRCSESQRVDLVKDDDILPIGPVQKDGMKALLEPVCSITTDSNSNVYICYPDSQTISVFDLEANFLHQLEMDLSFTQPECLAVTVSEHGQQLMAMGVFDLLSFTWNVQVHVLS